MGDGCGLGRALPVRANATWTSRADVDVCPTRRYRVAQPFQYPAWRVAITSDSSVPGAATMSVPFSSQIALLPEDGAPPVLPA